MIINFKCERKIHNMQSEENENISSIMGQLSIFLIFGELPVKLDHR